MLDYNDSEFVNFINKLENAEKEINRAGNIAIKNTTNWLKQESSKVISEQNRINPEILNNRLFESENPEIVTGKLYIGTKKVNFMRLSPVQTSTGVQAGDITIDHAFIAPAKSGSDIKLVYLRTTNKRLPLQKQMLTIDDKTSAFVESILGQVKDKLVENIKQELNFHG